MRGDLTPSTSDRRHVGEDEAVARDDLARHGADRAGEHRAAGDAGVELPVLAAGIDPRRQIREERGVESPRGEGRGKPPRIHADDRRLEAGGDHARGERGGVAAPERKLRRDAGTRELPFAVGAHVLEKEVSEHDPRDAVGPRGRRRAGHRAFVVRVDARAAGSTPCGRAAPGPRPVGRGPPRGRRASRRGRSPDVSVVRSPTISTSPRSPDDVQREGAVLAGAPRDERRVERAPSPDRGRPWLGPAVPENVGDAAAEVLVAGHDEEGVGEAVQVAHVHGPTGSDRDSATTSRSARRQTVRATWRCAAPGLPPGRMKFSSGESSSERRSMSFSRATTWRSSIRGTGRLRLVLLEDAEIGAEMEELVLDVPQRLGDRVAQTRSRGRRRGRC